MFENYDDIMISQISIAIHVPAGGGTNVHSNRPFHGLVLNDLCSEKDYFFSDGSILSTHPCELFYLPKGSSYTVKDVQIGGCYAINFDANISEEEPFAVKVRNYDGILKIFRDAEKKWKQASGTSRLFIRKCLYDILLELQSEQAKTYVPNAKYDVISPAVKKISSDFTDPEISVAELSSLCGISEVYFRRLFLSKFGVSPKEYIVSKRLSYAALLISSEQLQISEIARMCGYEELSHFSREFKKKFGTSPKNYLSTRA